MRQPVSEIRTIGRVTQGVKLVKLDEGAKISSISRVIHEDQEVEASTEEEPEKSEEKEKSKDES
jgi:DNA gyrase subunit A